jgi:putative addiction module component (TIGR02574 family)
MARDAKGLLEEALRLSEEDRASLAGELLLSLHPSADPDVAAAWEAEIDRRLDEFETAKSNSKTWGDIKAAIHQDQRDRLDRKTSP